MELAKQAYEFWQPCRVCAVIGTVPITVTLRCERSEPGRATVIGES